MRSSRHDDANASESTPFFSLYDPDRFGVTSDKRMRGMYGMPPTVLDTYMRSDWDNETGALVLVPMSSDMLSDIWPPGEMHFTLAMQYTQSVASARRAAGDARIDVVDLGVQDGANDGYGCDYHPSTTTHERMAKTLVEAIQQATGW